MSTFAGGVLGTIDYVKENPVKGTGIALVAISYPGAALLLGAGLSAKGIYEEGSKAVATKDADEQSFHHGAAIFHMFGFGTQAAGLWGKYKGNDATIEEELFTHEEILDSRKYFDRQAQARPGGLSDDDLLIIAKQKRDTYAGFYRRKSATYAGGIWNGQAAAGRSGGGSCAEDDLVSKLGPNAYMTGAIGFRRAGEGQPLELIPRNVCVRCQGKYTPEQFVPSAQGDPGGAWGR